MDRKRSGDKAERTSYNRESYLRRRHRPAYLQYAKDYAQKWRRANPEKYKAIKIRARERMRSQTIMALGGRCKRCGITDLDVLTLHHVVPVLRTRNEAGSRRATSVSEWKLAAKSPNDYEILCANCHMRVTREQWERGLFRGKAAKKAGIASLTDFIIK
jgi:hypothetical protein